MINDVVPNLPELTEDQLEYRDLDVIVKELATAQNILMIYETNQGEIRLQFDQLSAPLYACMAGTVFHSQNVKVYEFLKLVRNAVEESENGGKLKVYKCPNGG